MQYDLTKIGEVISNRRKELGLTQEALADMLSVTPQAISKWERGSGLPDVAFLPDLALTLGLSLDELFGATKASPKSNTFNFPEEYKGLPLVLVFGDRACYSDVEVASSTDRFVSFVGGSSANLATGELNFKGSGNVELVSRRTFAKSEPSEEVEASRDDTDKDENLTQTDTETLSDELAGIDSLKIDSRGGVDFVISYNPDGLLRWRSDYYDEIEKDLQIKREGNTLVFLLQPGRVNNFSYFNFSHGSDAVLYLEMPCKTLKSFSLLLSGGSDIDLGLDALTSDIEISGYGDLRAGDLGDATIRISGAGDLRAKSMGQGDIVLPGAGDIRIDEVCGDLEVSIPGAGDVEIKSGDIDKLKLRIPGAGSFRAKGLSCESADIRMAGVGSAVIGQIRGESKERVGFLSSLEVLKRGK